LIRRIYREGKGWAKQWRDFEHLFWKTSYQASVIDTDTCLALMSASLENWIAVRSQQNSAILEELPGNCQGSKKQSLAACARGQMHRLSETAVKHKWIRAQTWKVFSFGMAASQRGENAF